MRFEAFSLLALLFMLNSACMHQMRAAKLHGDTVQVKLEEFEGIYLGRREPRQEQQKYLGSEIQIGDFVPMDVRRHVLANDSDFERTTPALSVSVVREIEGPEIAESKVTYQLLGINRGPIDLVHYELDDEHMAFERILTTHVGPLLKHQREVLYYRKGESIESSKNAGFNVQHSFELHGRALTVTQEVLKLGSPWTDVFNPDQKMQIGKRSAKFFKVDTLKKKADIRSMFPRFEM